MPRRSRQSFLPDSFAYNDRAAAVVVRNRSRECRIYLEDKRAFPTDLTRADRFQMSLSQTIQTKKHAQLSNICVVVIVVVAAAAVALFLCEKFA